MAFCQGWSWAGGSAGLSNGCSWFQSHALLLQRPCQRSATHITPAPYHTRTNQQRSTLTTHPCPPPQVLFSDTVGFIQKLPTQLVAAFRATLEEIQDASLVLHVVDSSHDNSEAQSGAVLQVGRLDCCGY